MAVRDVVNTILAELRDELRRDQIQLSAMTCLPPASCKRCRSEHLDSILRNLILNACDAPARAPQCQDR